MSDGIFFRWLCPFNAKYFISKKLLWLFFGVVVGLSASDAAWGQQGPGSDGDLQSNFGQSINDRFKKIDQDSDGRIALDEWLKSKQESQTQEQSYVTDFKFIDQDGDGELSLAEMQAPSVPAYRTYDPGKKFRPFNGLTGKVDDTAIECALRRRGEELLAKADKNWTPLGNVSIPDSFQVPSAAKGDKKSAEGTLRNAINSTVILCFILPDGRVGKSGGVVISEDGLTLTNHHVASIMRMVRMFALTTDGRCLPVTDYKAEQPLDDVALVKIGGAGFSFSQISSKVTVHGI